MTDHPILFSGPMVRALLEGRKTQTRRVLKDQPNDCLPVGGAELVQMADDPASWCWLNGFDGSILGAFDVPFATGDRLWVREPHFAHGRWIKTGKLTKTGKEKREFQRVKSSAVLFDLDPGLVRPDNLDDVTGWYARLGRFMFRADSRLTLTVTDVRVQRLQDISHEDCRAEGVGGYAQSEFQTLWNTLNADRGFGWQANPWVVAYTFTLHPQNIDQEAG